MGKYDISKFNELLGVSPGNEDGHYKGSIQPSVYASSNRLVFTLANIIKYIFRYQYKNGKEDLQKALWYTRFQILDHSNFFVPFAIEGRVTIEEYNESNDFNDLQRFVNTGVDSYNRSANLCYMKSIESFLEESLKDAC